MRNLLLALAGSLFLAVSCTPSSGSSQPAPAPSSSAPAPSSAETPAPPSVAPTAAPAQSVAEKAKKAPATAPAPAVSTTPAAVAPATTTAPPVAPVPEAPAVPATPPPAPDLSLEPATALQLGSVTVKPATLPAGTVVKYSLDGSDPAAGKPWPAAGLVVAQSARLRVWAALPGGDAATAEGLYTVGELWVQPGASGDGSWAKPLGTLDEAQTKALSLGIKRLRLMSGQWTDKHDWSGTWELSGGWKALGEAGSASVFVGSKQSGSTQKEPAYTFKILSGAKVSMAGLEVRSPNSSFAAAVQVEAGASLEVSRSRLVGGNGLYGYGLRATGANLVSVVDSMLSGGDGGSSFALSADKSTVKVVRSTLDAGTGNAVSYGVNATLSKVTLISSVVWGGAANSSYAVGLYSCDDSVVQASTLLGGKGTMAWAVYLSESQPEITACLIGSNGKTKSYGIFANYGKSLPRSLRSNAFFGSATGAFAGADLGAVSEAPTSGAFLDASGRAFDNQKGNVKAEPVLGPAPDYRLLASSPSVLLKGADALTGDAATDRGGALRGASPAYGAWATSP